MKFTPYLFLFVLCSNFSLIAQSFKNLEGTYLVKQDSIVHSYEFNKKKLKVKLNIDNPYKVQFVYEYRCDIINDTILKVVLLDIISEELELNGNKKEKPKSYIKDLYMMSGYFFSLWTLEKVDNHNLFIKVEPSSIKWPASKGHLANYYSGFENSFTLVPHKN